MSLLAVNQETVIFVLAWSNIKKIQDIRILAYTHIYLHSKASQVLVCFDSTWILALLTYSTNTQLKPSSHYWHIIIIRLKILKNLNRANIMNPTNNASNYSHYSHKIMWIMWAITRITPKTCITCIKHVNNVSNYSHYLYYSHYWNIWILVSIWLAYLCIQLKPSLHYSHHFDSHSTLLA